MKKIDNEIKLPPDVTSTENNILNNLVDNEAIILLSVGNIKIDGVTLVKLCKEIRNNI